MIRITWSITLVVILYITSTNSDWISPALLDYVISVIEYFNDQPGRFECVLYDIGGGLPYDNWFVELLQSPRLFRIPHYVINMTYQDSVRRYLPSNPTLMVINLRKPDYSIDPKGISYMFLGLNPHTRIMVLFAGAIFSFMKEMAQFLTEKTLYTRVVFVEIRIMKIVRTGFDGEIEDFTGLVHPRKLFRNLLRDLRGRPLRYTSESALRLNDRQWMEGTAQFLNATAQYAKSPCDELGEDLFMACYLHHLKDSRAVISVTVKEFTMKETLMTRMFFRVFPLTGAIAVPGGSVSTVTSVLLCRLHWGVWMTIVLLAMVLYLVNKSWLKRTQRHPCIELMIVVVIAVALHSYATRIMSFMIDMPRNGAMRSVEDLIDSEVIMKIRKPLLPFTILEERLGGITAEKDSDGPKLDGVSAYYGLSPDTEIFVQSWTSYEDQMGLIRYQVLREYFGMRLGTYIVMLSDPLKEYFYSTQRTFFEAGLLEKWTWDECVQRVENWKMVDPRVGVEILSLNDLFLVWVFLVCGFFASFIAFGLERFFRQTKN